MSVRRPGWARSAATLIALSFRAAPLRALVVFVLTIAESSFGVLTTYQMKLLIDAAVARDLGGALWIAGAMGLTFTVLLIAAIAGFLVLVGLQERTALLIDRRIIELTAGLPGLEHHERPDYNDELILLRDHRGDISQALNAAVRNVAFLFNVGGTIALLATLHPILIALPLFGLPSLAGAARMQRILIRADEGLAEPRRAQLHYLELATTAAPGKELRLFGAGDEIVRRHDAIARENEGVIVRARLRAAAWYSAGWSLFALAYVAAIVLVLARAVRGELTIGDVALGLSLMASIDRAVSNGANMAMWLLQTLKTVSRFLWLTDYARERGAPVGDPLSPPARIERGIEFRDVTFAYPGTETPVLRDVTLSLPAGSTVAIVGDNGAGKSTLVKLLCRFYEPTAGSISVDGLDLSRFEHEAWRERIAGGFQDFARFELLAREVVGVGDVVRLDDEASVWAALARASATDVIDGLERGLEQPVGRSFDDGVELSGGQWQKLALGRAMMREAPLLLVLDEPTAALDAQTEHALFERYAGAARDAARATGAITVFVSHRFSTVRMADLIVVIDDGRVVEAGSHAELIARAGLYAELYELQARAYR